MKATTLILLAQPPGPFEKALEEARTREGGGGIATVDLSEADLDYGALIESIFEADKVEVW